MTENDSFLGVSARVQIAVIGVLGVGLTVAGLLSSSAVDPEYDPLLFGIGLVMVLYAVVASAWRGVSSLLGD